MEGHVPTRLAATNVRPSPAKSDPLLQAGHDLHREPPAGRAGTFSMFPQRVGARMLHELRSALPPTIFFFDLR